MPTATSRARTCSSSARTPRGARGACRSRDFVQAFYVGERVLWDAALELAHDERVAARGARVRVAPAALLRGRHDARGRGVPGGPGAARGHGRADPARPARGPARRARARARARASTQLRAAGLRDGRAFVVISATPGDCPGRRAPAARRRGGAGPRRRRPRRCRLRSSASDEIVLVVPADGRLRRRSCPGSPTPSSGSPTPGCRSPSPSARRCPALAQIPDAYREASTIRLARGATPGVVALTEMSAFEYLTLRPDPTASRLIAPAVHEFVAQDAARRRQLIATLREYVACDFNARRAAEQPPRPRQHRALPAGPDRGAHRLRPAPRQRPDRDPDRGPAGRRRIGCSTQSRRARFRRPPHVLGAARLRRRCSSPRAPNRRSADEREPRHTT